MSRAPGPKGGLIWGSLGAFKRDPIGLLQRAVAEHGDVVRLRFGPVAVHLINDPQHIEHVLSRNSANYDKLTRSARRIRDTCGGSLLSASPTRWQRHRRLIQPAFQPRMFDNVPEVMAPLIDPMLDRWEGQRVDVVAEMMRLVIAGAVRLLFSADEGAARVEAALEVLLADTWRRIWAAVDPAMISPRFHRPEFKAALAEVDDIVLTLIRQRRAAADWPDDVLSRLLRAHEAEEGEAQLTDKELRDAAVTLLLAGHETTANALSWVLWRAADGHEDAPVDQLFAEGLRLYPSIWVIERRAKAADMIGGFEIPKGSSVMISPYLLHRRAETWPDPDRFDPARFAPEAVEARDRLACLPFGLGPHRCVGLYLARQMAETVLSAVYARYRLTPVPGQLAGMEPGITLRHEGPLWMDVRTV